MVNSALTLRLSEMCYLIKLAMVALGSPLSDIGWLIKLLIHIFTIHSIIYTSQLFKSAKFKPANQISIHRLSNYEFDRY